jgi:hypothetical protein
LLKTPPRLGCSNVRDRRNARPSRMPATIYTVPRFPI